MWTNPSRGGGDGPTAHDLAALSHRVAGLKGRAEERARLDAAADAAEQAFQAALNSAYSQLPKVTISNRGELSNLRVLQESRPREDRYGHLRREVEDAVSPRPVLRYSYSHMIWCDVLWSFPPYIYICHINLLIVREVTPSLDYDIICLYIINNSSIFGQIWSHSLVINSTIELLLKIARLNHASN